MHDEPRNSSRCTPARHASWITLVWIARFSLDELRRLGVVGEDAADLGRGEEHVLGSFALEEPAHGHGSVELELGMRAQDEVGEAAARSRRTSAEPARPRWPAT